MTTTMTTTAKTQDHHDEIRDVTTTGCCVVGGGPAGAVLALLLARRGIPVTLLEMHKDFDRNFRGDTIHPSVLEVLDQIGLAAPLHQLPHTRTTGLTIQFADGPFTPFEFTRLNTRFPYIMMIPQVQFLKFIVAEAGKYPNFRLVMSANVKKLVEEDGVIRGVQYLGADDWHELRATLTVAADGRFSQVRQLAGIEPVKTAPPMDVLWFKLPKLGSDDEEFSRGLGSIGRGRILVVLDRGDYFQTGLVFPKGRYQELRAAGVEAIRNTITEIAPSLARNAETLTDWQQFSMLSVESSICQQWFKPGLLLIGDAAHVMSPVGGLGINYAIQDAVETVNVLAGPLQAGRVSVADLARVQRRREWPTRIAQTMQSRLQKNLIANALESPDMRVPWQLRLIRKLPLLRDLPAYLVAFGARRVRLRQP